MDDEQKQDKQSTYENWRAITESDFVTQYIKTWFAFVSTLREMYPDKAQPYYKATGDSPYITAYKSDFAELNPLLHVVDIKPLEYLVKRPVPQRFSRQKCAIQQQFHLLQVI